MKQQNYTEQAIADRLAKEGRTCYDPKTIGSRWIRIRKVLQTAADELLDEDLIDWREAEVCN